MTLEISARKLRRPAMIIGALCLGLGMVSAAYLLMGAPPTLTAVAARAPSTIPSPTATRPAMSTELSTLEQAMLATTDLGSGSKEFSGVTINEDLDRLLIVDDEDVLFEYDLAPNGTPIAPPRRSIKIHAGAGDIEGIAWMGNTTYVLAHETDGRLMVVTIAEGATEINIADVSRTVDTGVRGDDGKGVEGVAYLDAQARGMSGIEFIVVEERPATLHMIGIDGTVASSIALELPDASGVWAMSPNRVSVVSDEGRVVVALDIDQTDAVTVVDRMSLELRGGRFEQPEGIAWARDLNRLYIVGESPEPGRYAFGLWQAAS